MDATAIQESKLGLKDAIPEMEDHGSLRNDRDGIWLRRYFYVRQGFQYSLPSLLSAIHLKIQELTIHLGRGAQNGFSGCSFPAFVS